MKDTRPAPEIVRSTLAVLFIGLLLIASLWILRSFLLAWSILVVISDTFLRPYLIKKGADLPLLLILSGVIGGLVAFGVIGLFIGPVALAVTYTLLLAWIKSMETDGGGPDWQAGILDQLVSVT